MHARHPDVFLVGNSHTAALAHGLREHGISCALLSWKQHDWHSGRVVADPRTGIGYVGENNADRIGIAQARLDVTNLCDPGLPVIGSFGLSAGLFSTGFLDIEHFRDGKNIFDHDPYTPITCRRYSSGLVRDYLDHSIAHQLDIARGFARNTHLTLVAPPRLRQNIGRLFIEQQLRQRFAETGAQLYDPSQTFGEDGTMVLDKGYLADNVHGTKEYGGLVIGDMINKGLLSL